MSTSVHGGPLVDWGQKPGNRKRIRYLRRAIDDFNGQVDVVIVSGEPGKSYGTARPWLQEGSRSNSYWEVTNFDDQIGHFEVHLRLNR